MTPWSDGSTDEDEQRRQQEEDLRRWGADPQGRQSPPEGDDVDAGSAPSGVL